VFLIGPQDISLLSLSLSLSLSLYARVCVRVVWAAEPGRDTRTSRPRGTEADPSLRCQHTFSDFD